MGEIGDRLRETREEQGLSYTDIEASTRIRDVFVQALEEERFDDLPGGAYTKGLLHNYAKFLGLDAEKLLASYRKMRGEGATGAPRVLNEPLMGPTRSILWAGIFLGIMILLVSALAAWYAYNRFYLQRDPWPLSRSQPTQAVTISTDVVDTTPTPRRTRPSPSPTEREGAVAPTEGATATPEPTSTPPPTATTVTLSTPTAAYTRRPTLAATPTPGILVQADLTAPTYLEVTRDGEEVFVGTLEENDDRSWTAKNRIVMRIGNAGGISLTVNGVQVDPLGESGEVVEVEYALGNLPQP